MSGEVSAVVVTADPVEMTTACVRAVLAQAAEVIVVDNGAAEGTGAALSALDPRVRTLSPPKAVGYPGACNFGAEQARAELLLFLNADVTTSNGAVARLVIELERHEAAVAASGRLVDPGTGRTQDEYRPRTFPGLLSLTVQLIGLARYWPGNPVTRRHLNLDLDGRRTIPVDQPAGACLLVRRSVFEAVGGFDDGYWFWYDDVDLARRLSRVGTVLYVPSSVFEHHGGASFARWPQARIVRVRHDALLRYVRHHFGRARQAGVGLVLLAVLTARGRLARGEARQAFREARAAALDLVRTGGRGGATERLAASVRRELAS